jgi:hypothetical protein
MKKKFINLKSNRILGTPMQGKYIPLLLEIPIILEPILHKIKFFKIIFLL